MAVSMCLVMEADAIKKYLTVLYFARGPESIIRLCSWNRYCNAYGTKRGSCVPRKNFDFVCHWTMVFIYMTSGCLRRPEPKSVTLNVLRMSRSTFEEM